MTNDDQQRRQANPMPLCHQLRPASANPMKTSRYCLGNPISHDVVLCLLCLIYTLSKHRLFSQESVVAKHHMPLFQANFTKHQVSVLSKASSHKTASRKTSHGTVEFPKKPEISTSDSLFRKLMFDD